MTEMIAVGIGVALVLFVLTVACISSCSNPLMDRWTSLVEKAANNVAEYVPPILWPITWPLFGAAYVACIPLALIGGSLFIPRRWRKES